MQPKGRRIRKWPWTTLFDGLCTEDLFTEGEEMSETGFLRMAFCYLREKG